jgi:hypothetical protein
MLVFALFFFPLRMSKSLLAIIHVRIQNLIMLVVTRNPPGPCPGLSDEKVEKEANSQGAEERKGEALAGLRRLGGATLTITVSVGAVRLIVVTVKVVALTLWIPFYSSARTYFALFDRLCRTGTSGRGCGFVVDIRLGP